MPRTKSATRERRAASTPKVSAKILPHLWFDKEAVEAAKFYASVFPDSHVDSVTTIPAETPSGPAGSVEVVEFTLATLGLDEVQVNVGAGDKMSWKS